MSSVGKILFTNKKKYGVKCTLHPKQNVINVTIEPGFYLITEEILNEEKDVLFLEILCRNNLVLLNSESIKKFEIL